MRCLKENDHPALFTRWKINIEQAAYEKKLITGKKKALNKQINFFIKLHWPNITYYKTMWFLFKDF